MSISGLSQSSTKVLSRERRSPALASSIPRSRKSKRLSGNVTVTRVPSGTLPGTSSSSILPSRYIPSTLLLIGRSHDLIRCYQRQAGLQRFDRSHITVPCFPQSPSRPGSVSEPAEGLSQPRSSFPAARESAPDSHEPVHFPDPDGSTCHGPRWLRPDLRRRGGPRRGCCRRLHQLGRSRWLRPDRLW